MSEFKNKEISVKSNVQNIYFDDVILDDDEEILLAVSSYRQKRYYAYLLCAYGLVFSLFCWVFNSALTLSFSFNFMTLNVYLKQFYASAFILGFAYLFFMEYMPFKVFITNKRLYMYRASVLPTHNFSHYLLSNLTEIHEYTSNLKLNILKLTCLMPPRRPHHFSLIGLAKHEPIAKALSNNPFPSESNLTRLSQDSVISPKLEILKSLLISWLIIITLTAVFCLKAFEVISHHTF